MSDRLDDALLTRFGFVELTPASGHTTPSVRWYVRLVQEGLVSVRVSAPRDWQLTAHQRSGCLFQSVSDAAEFVRVCRRFGLERVDLPKGVAVAAEDVGDRPAGGT